MLEINRVLTNNPAEEKNGYCRILKVGPWIFSSITNGRNHSLGTVDDNVEEQVRQAFRNIAGALKPLGASFQDLVKIEVWCSDKSDSQKVWDTIRDCTGGVMPAATITFGPLPAGLKAEISITIFSTEGRSVSNIEHRVVV